MPKIIGMIGDSTFRGWGAGDVDFFTNSRASSIPILLAQAFTSLGQQTSSESRVGSGKWTRSRLEASDPAIDTGNWGFFSSTGNALAGDLFSYGSQLYSIDFTGDTAFLLCCDFAGNGIIRFRVDGGAWQTHNLNTGAVTLNHVSITVGSSGAHTLEIDKDPGSNNNVYFCGVLAYDSSDDAVIVSMGANGYLTEDYVTTGLPWLTYDAMDSFTFDAVVFNTGINDTLQSITSVNFESDYTTFINKIKNVNPGVQLFFTIPNDIQAGLDYVPTSITSLASSLGATIIDSRNAISFSDYTTASAAGLMDDIYHPNAAGYQSITAEYVNVMFNSVFPPSNVESSNSALQFLMMGEV